MYMYRFLSSRPQPQGHLKHWPSTRKVFESFCNLSWLTCKLGSLNVHYLALLKFHGLYFRDMLPVLLNIQCSKFSSLHPEPVVYRWINVGIWNEKVSRILILIVTRHQDEIFLLKTGKIYNQSLISLEKQRFFELYLRAVIMVVHSGWLRWSK